jgi:hypothetical protein
MNMASPELWKSWKVTEAHLRHARKRLSQPLKEKQENFQNLLRFYENYLEHNELELALDVLEELGQLTSCQGSFWRDLERAAATMGLTHKASQLHAKFLETIEAKS